MSSSSLPRLPVIDTKVRDTTGDQVLRFLLRLINVLWAISLFAMFFPAGIAWVIGSIFISIQLRKARKQRYSDNARALANLNRGQ